MTHSPPVYQLSRVVHYYQDRKVLDIDDLSIQPGSITGLIGPNGSGKSTLLKLLAFVMSPSEGQIRFNGKPETPFSPGVRSRVTLVTQKPYLLKRSVYDNIAYGLRLRRDQSDLNNRVSTAMAQVGLSYDHFALRRWHALSGGEAQRVSLAARLILKPAVLLMDEPVASVDQQSAVMIKRAALAARKEWGTTLIIASHDLAWLFDSTDTQISINRGTLFATGTQIVIPGPYQMTDLPIKMLPDGQAIRLPPQTAPDTTAIIRRKDIHMMPAARSAHEYSDNGAENKIFGRIHAIHLAGTPDRIMARITVADMEIMLSLDRELLDPARCHVGMEVALMFHTRAIQWR